MYINNIYLLQLVILCFLLMPVTSQYCYNLQAQGFKVAKIRVILDEEHLMKVHGNSCLHFPAENHSDSDLIVFLRNPQKNG
jgi:hypothetical protein